MIDFNNASYIKLKAWDIPQAAAALAELLISGEQVYAAFKGIRDSVVFTDKRIVTLNVQGMTGKKRDYASLPYSRIHAFSLETAGTFDLDCELELWLSGLGKVKLEFSSGVDIRWIGQYISAMVLR